MFAEESSRDLLGALKTEIQAAQHQDRGQRPGQEPAEQNRHRQDDEELVAERPDRDLPDDRELALWRQARHVTWDNCRVVHDHAERLASCPAGSRHDVVRRCRRKTGQGRNVVKEREQTARHGFLSIRHAVRRARQGFLRTARVDGHASRAGASSVNLRARIGSRQPPARLSCKNGLN